MESKALTAAEKLKNGIKSLSPFLQDWLKTRKDTVQRANDALNNLANRIQNIERAKLVGATIILLCVIMRAYDYIFADPAAAESGTTDVLAVLGGTVFVCACMCKVLVESLATDQIWQLVEDESIKLKPLKPCLDFVMKQVGILEEICTFHQMHVLKIHIELGETVFPVIHQLNQPKNIEEYKGNPNGGIREDSKPFAQFLDCLKDVVFKVKIIKDFMEKDKGLLSPGKVPGTVVVIALTVFEVCKLTYSLRSKVKTEKESQLHGLLEQLREEQKYSEKLNEMLEEKHVAVQEGIDKYKRQMQEYKDARKARQMQEYKEACEREEKARKMQEYKKDCERMEKENARQHKGLLMMAVGSVTVVAWTTLKNILLK